MSSPYALPPPISPGDIELRAKALETVLALARISATAEGLEALAAQAVAVVQAYTAAPAVCIFLYDERRRVFRLLAEQGFDVEHFPPPSSALPADGSLTGLAAARGQTVTSSDISADLRIEPETRARLVLDGFGEGASVPILHHGQIVGALNILYKTGTRLRAEERRLLEAMAGTLGVAMTQRQDAEVQQHLEEQVRRGQHLESLGVLAGGIAHDFNNLLVGILGNVELARKDALAEGMSRIAGLLEEALRAVDRATGLVRQLLTFAKGGAPVKQATSALPEIVRDAAQFAVRGASVRCEVVVEGEIGVVEVDLVQVAQVVQNLVLNAAQASGAGGTISVRLDRRELAEPEGLLAAGPWLRLQVSDRGRGIPSDALPRIFEPFFSSRQGGTGLGLAVCHSIVHRHGGQIAVQSSPGQGTTFTVQIPAGSARAAVVAPASPETALGGGRALVMDDEPAVRFVAGQMLADLGFEVEETKDGAEALAAAMAAQAGARPFAVALLDVTVVGGTGGLDILDELRQASPSTRLVLSTGYSAAYVPGMTDAHGADAVLEKPYSLERLAATLARAKNAR